MFLTCSIIFLPAESSLGFEVCQLPSVPFVSGQRYVTWTFVRERYLAHPLSSRIADNPRVFLLLRSWLSAPQRRPLLAHWRVPLQRRLSFNPLTGHSSCFLPHIQSRHRLRTPVVLCRTLRLRCQDSRHLGLVRDFGLSCASS